jgi:hypothetical protein
MRKPLGGLRYRDVAIDFPAVCAHLMRLKEDVKCLPWDGGMGGIRAGGSICLPTRRGDCPEVAGCGSHGSARHWSPLP